MAGFGACLALAYSLAQAVDVSRWAFGSASPETVQHDLRLLFPGSTILLRGENIVVEKASVDGGLFTVRATDGFARMDHATEDYVKGGVEADVNRSGNRVSITFKAAPEPAPTPEHDHLSSATLWGLVLLGLFAGAVFLQARRVAIRIAVALARQGVIRVPSKASRSAFRFVATRLQWSGRSALAFLHWMCRTSSGGGRLIFIKKRPKNASHIVVSEYGALVIPDNPNPIRRTALERRARTQSWVGLRVDETTHEAHVVADILRGRVPQLDEAT